jgi:hypothetical protein
MDLTWLSVFVAVGAAKWWILLLVLKAAALVLSPLRKCVVSHSDHDVVMRFE